VRTLSLDLLEKEQGTPHRAKDGKCSVEIEGLMKNKKKHPAQKQTRGKQQTGAEISKERE